MQSNETSEIIRRFNQAFLEHDPAILEDLVAPDCVMESIQPAPNGTRYEGYDVNLAFWQAMAADRVNRLRGRRHRCDGRPRHHPLALPFRRRRLGPRRQPDPCPRRPDRRSPGLRQITGSIGALA